MMFIAGVVEVISAFQVKSWGRFIFWLLLGVLYIVAGFFAFDNPLLTAVWLTLFLGRGARRLRHRAHLSRLQHEDGLALGLDRDLRPHHASSRRDHPGSLALSSLWTLGIFLGVDLVFAGASWIGLALGLRNAPAV